MFSYSRAVILFLSLALLVRFAVGAHAFFAPVAALETFGVDLGDSGHGLYLLMVFGMRDMVIVMMILIAPRTFIKPLILCCIAIELSDLAAATLTLQAGDFTAEQWRGQLAAVLGALIPETIALLLVHREDRRSQGAAIAAR